MPEITTLLPPDAEQLELAAEVNLRLGGDKRITFFRVRTAETAMRYGVVFSYGCARKTVQQDAPWFDADELIAAVADWVQRL